MAVAIDPIGMVRVIKQKPLLILITAGLLAGCQFPTPQGAGLPMPSSPSSSPAGAPSTPPPSSPSGSPSSPSPSEPSDSSGSPSSPGSEGSSAPDSSSNPQSGASDPVYGESMPWPEGEEPSSGDPAGSLDEQLDEALGDFDEAMEAAGGGEEEIDILDPMSSGGGSASDDQPPLYEEGSLGGDDGSGEDQGIAQRAEAGAASGSSSSDGQQGSSSSQGGAGSGAAPSGDQGGNTSPGDDPGGSEEVIPIPEDVGDGRQDDIVLRQIRDAAMKERDPVLRDKLWDEYRRIRDQR